MPLSRSIYTADEFELPRRALFGLPGVFADSLPDSFGNRLVRKWMESHGIDISAITPLDRLAYVGTRGMGALVYEPDIRQEQPKPTVLDMRKLVEEARLALNADLSKMEGPDTLREIIRVGTSAGGAQAKAVVGWNRETDSFLAGDCDLPPGYEHWLIKFTPQGLPSAGEEEYAVYLKARAAGVEMSECRLYELDGVKHFMTRRFDRDGRRRHHVQTFRAIRALPPDVSLEMNSYGQLFETIVALGLGYDARSEMFRRMAFNVYSDETDDHSKNFSFLMDREGKWRLSPAYDLTYANDPNSNYINNHQCLINGKFEGITIEDLLKVGIDSGLNKRKMDVIIKEVKSAVRNWPSFAAQAEIPDNKALEDYANFVLLD